MFVFATQAGRHRGRRGCRASATPRGRARGSSRGGSCSFPRRTRRGDPHRVALLSQHLPLQAELDRPVAQPIERELGPREEAEAEAEPDLGAPSKPKKSCTRSPKSPPPSGRAKRWVRRKAIRWRGSRRFVGRVITPKSAPSRPLRGRSGFRGRLGRGRGRFRRGGRTGRVSARVAGPRRATRGPTSRLGLRRETTAGGPSPRPRRDHEPALHLPMPEPQYSEHSNLNVPASPPRIPDSPASLPSEWLPSPSARGSQCHASRRSSATSARCGRPPWPRGSQARSGNVMR